MLSWSTTVMWSAATWADSRTCGHAMQEEVRVLKTAALVSLVGGAAGSCTRKIDSVSRRLPAQNLPHELPRVCDDARCGTCCQPSDNRCRVQQGWGREQVRTRRAADAIKSSCCLSCPSPWKLPAAQALISLSSHSLAVQPPAAHCSMTAAAWHAARTAPLSHEVNMGRGCACACGLMPCDVCEASAEARAPLVKHSRKTSLPARRRALMVGLKKIVSSSGCAVTCSQPSISAMAPAD